MSAHVAQLRTVVGEGDARAGWLLPTVGNRFELLEGADPFVSRLVDDIGAARQQVNLSTYALHPGTPGGRIDRVTQAAMARANEGLPVTMIVDQVGSGLLLPGAKRAARRAFVEELRDNRVSVIVKPFTPGRGGLDDARFATDHRKLYEIDGRISYQGGINLVDSWSSWHDLMLRAEGPTSAQAGALLAGRWRDLGGSVDAARVAVLEAGLRAPVDDARHMALQLTNGSRARRELTDYFVDGVRGATDRVWLANPYLGDATAVGAVVDAARRGLDVRLLLAPKATHAQAQDVFTDPMRRAFAHDIAEAGGSVVLLPEFSHAKAAIVDGVAQVGSLNLDRFATMRNYENALATDSPEVIAALEQVFTRQQSRGIAAAGADVESWRGLSQLRRRLGFEY